MIFREIFAVHMSIAVNTQRSSVDRMIAIL